MKPKNWWILAVLFINLLFSGAAYANADFTIVNRTGHTIRSVFVAPGIAAWGSDRLGDHVLRDGYSVKIRFADDAPCIQGLFVIFAENDRNATWNDVDLCNLNTITLDYNTRTRVVSASSSL